MTEPILRGKHLYLRPIRIDDAVALAAANHLEEETGFQEDGRVPMSILSFASWIGAIPESDIVFAVCLNGSDTCIGTMSIRNIDRVNGTAETGSGLTRQEDRGRGLGTEAKRLLLEYAFSELGLSALSSTVYEGNTRSARALEKQGYRLAGRLTANALGAGGVFGDTLVFDITREDWARSTSPTRCQHE